jgi:hypothetical protein
MYPLKIFWQGLIFEKSIERERDYKSNPTAHNNRVTVADLYADFGHVLLQKFHKTPHFFNLNIADIGDAEGVGIGKFAGVNGKTPAPGQIMEFLKAVFGGLRLKDGGDKF